MALAGSFPTLPGNMGTKGGWLSLGARAHFGVNPDKLPKVIAIGVEPSTSNDLDWNRRFCASTGRSLGEVDVSIFKCLSLQIEQRTRRCAIDTKSRNWQEVGSTMLSCSVKADLALHRTSLHKIMSN